MLVIDAVHKNNSTFVTVVDVPEAKSKDQAEVLLGVQHRYHDQGTLYSVAEWALSPFNPANHTGVTWVRRNRND